MVKIPPMIVGGTLDDAECERWADACDVFAATFATLFMPTVCDHLFRATPVGPLAMFMCAAHPELVHCAKCFFEHVEAHGGPLPCAVSGCVHPIATPTTCDVLFASGRVIDLAGTGARLAMGMVGATAILCKRHGGGHRWKWAEMIDVLALEERLPSWDDEDQGEVTS
jgi:hypothetical protein